MAPQMKTGAPRTVHPAMDRPYHASAPRHNALALMETARACGACRGMTDPEARFCGHCGAMVEQRPPNAADPLVGVVLSGRYRIGELLGEGAMGKVYAAEQKLGTASRKVAIKVLQRDIALESHLRKRFRRECETVSALSHPNTVRVYDFGELDDGRPYIVMEFVAGRSLARLLAEHGPLAPERVARIVLQIGGSLAEAHAHGVVHRDLKPDNVQVVEQAHQRDLVKVLDFGIAKRIEDRAGSQSLTGNGMWIGTPEYMSPEQFQGPAVDARSDVYALALIAYELLTGTLPFDATLPHQWALAHTQDVPRPIEELPGAEAIPRPMREAVMRALEKAPADRPEDMAAFVRAFSGAADPEAAWVLATSTWDPASPPVRVPVRRSGPWLVAAAAAVASVLIALGALAARHSSLESPAAPALTSEAAPPVLFESSMDPDVIVGKSTPAPDPRSWFQGVHHVRNATNAQYALGAPDGRLAELGQKAILTLDLGPGRTIRLSGDSASDLIVHSPDDPGAPFLVSVGRDHDHFVRVARSKGGTLAIDLDALGVRGARYVSLRTAGTRPVQIDAVEAPGGARKS